MAIKGSFAATMSLAVAALAGCDLPPTTSEAPGDSEGVKAVASAIIQGTQLGITAGRNSGVALMMVTQGNGVSAMTCTATLLDTRWLLSAAHCIGAHHQGLVPDANRDGRMDEPWRIRIRFGNLTDPAGTAPPIEIAADDVLLHPNGGWGSGADVDAVLIHLESDAPTVAPPANHFTNGRMAIYGGGNDSLVRKMQTLMGYGMNTPGENGTGAGYLRTGQLVTSTANPNMVFFLTPSDPKNHVNHGDSGGPTFYDLRNSDGTISARFLTGISSATSEGVPGDQGIMSGYIGPQAFREWVSQTVSGKLKPTIFRSQSGFTNVANLIDGNVLTKTDHPGTVPSGGTLREAWVELDLGGTFTLGEVRLAEDNGGAAHVDSYRVDCWTGSAWTTLFTDTSTTVATPRMDEHPISNGCRTSRVRLTLRNDGPLEAFEFEVYAANERSLTIAVDPPQAASFGCTTNDTDPGTWAMPVGSSPGTCAVESCGPYLFHEWLTTPGLEVTHRNDPCTYVVNMQTSGSLKAKFVKPIVTLDVQGGPNGVVQPSGVFSLSYGTKTDFVFVPDDGYRLKGYYYPDMNTFVPTHWTTLEVTATEDAILRVEFELDMAYFMVLNVGVGTTSPSGEFERPIGSSVTFTFTPGAGHRMFQLCEPDVQICRPYTSNTFTKTNVSGASLVVAHFEPANAIANHSGKCLDVAGGGTANGTQFQQWTCNTSGSNAQWFFARQVSSGVYELVNGGSNKCVDISGASRAVGAKVQIWQCSATNAQRFRLQDAGGLTRFQNVNSNLCLEVTGSGAANGAKVTQNTCGTGTNQKFRFPR